MSVAHCPPRLKAGLGVGLGSEFSSWNEFTPRRAEAVSRKRSGRRRGRRRPGRRSSGISRNYRSGSHGSSSADCSCGSLGLSSLLYVATPYRNRYRFCFGPTIVAGPFVQSVDYEVSRLLAQRAWFRRTYSWRQRLVIYYTIAVFLSSGFREARPRNASHKARSIEPT